MPRIASSLVVLFLLLAAGAAAADVSGKWTARITSREGGSRTVIFVFSVSGETLVGKMVDASGEHALSLGRIKGDELSFTIVYDLAGNKVERHFKATRSGESLAFTYEGPGGVNRRNFRATRM